MILDILGIINCIFQIGLLIYAAYCFYKFLIGDKEKKMKHYGMDYLH